MYNDDKFNSNENINGNNICFWNSDAIEYFPLTKQIEIRNCIWSG